MRYVTTRKAVTRHFKRYLGGITNIYERHGPELFLCDGVFLYLCKPMPRPQCRSLRYIAVHARLSLTFFLIKRCCHLQKNLASSKQKIVRCIICIFSYASRILQKLVSDIFSDYNSINCRAPFTRNCHRRAA